MRQPGTTVRLLGVAALLVALALAPLAEAKSRSGRGTHPWLVVLCHFSDSPAAAADRQYYRQLFTEEGAGELNVFDYWRDVSFGQLSIRGTEVTDWVLARDRRGTAISRDTWRSYSRLGKARACANGASGVDFKKYWGVVALFPEAVTTTTNAIDASATTVDVATNAYFPDTFPRAPFLMDVNPGEKECGRARRGTPCYELVRVTAVSGNTLTIQRGRGGTKAGSHAAQSTVNGGGDLFGTQGQATEALIQGKKRTLALALLGHQANVSALAHEMGHGLGFQHSFAQSRAPASYNNCPDIFSFASCVYAFTGLGTAFGGSLLGEPAGAKGPGMVAPSLDRNGLIPASERRIYDPAKGQQTLTLHSLSDPGAIGKPGWLAVRVPAQVSLPTGRRTRTWTDYYSIEYRADTGWDSGFPADSVNLQLYGRNGRSYWVDRTPLVDKSHVGLLYPGDGFADRANNVYVSVNSRDIERYTATITIAPTLIETRATWAAALTGRTGERVRLAAQLTVKGTYVPAPNQPVSFQLGDSTRCTALTNHVGRADCEVDLPAPGTYEARVIFLGSQVYRSARLTKRYSVSP